MTARYAIYDPRTDRDIREFPDLVDAYAEIDRLAKISDTIYGIRIAREHRAQMERTWEVQKVRAATLERAMRGH